MEKSECLQGRGQHEINMEQESLEENQIGEDETSIKLDYIKEEVLISSAAEDWSAVLSSPIKQAAGSNGVLVDPLENRNNYMDGQNSDTDVDGWINDGIGNTLPSDDNHAPEKGVDSRENSHSQHFQQAHHESERGIKRQLLKCFHCSGSFSSEVSLAEHMKTHAGQSRTTERSHGRRYIGTYSGGHSQGQKRGRQGPKTTFPWTDEQEEDLVAWWRQNESLYNGNCHGYLNRPRRDKLFATKAEEIGSGCTSEDIQTHLRSLRTKMNHILKDNTGEGWQPRTPRGKWVWDRLHFIIPFIIQRNIRSTNKFGKGSSGEDSPSGGSDVSMGVDTVVPGTSNNVGSVSSLKERYAGLQSRSRGRGRPRGRGARHHIPPKKIRVDIGTQGQFIRTKSTTSNLDKSLMTYNQHTSVPHRPQQSVDVPQAPTSSIPNISTHHRPTGMISMPNVSTHHQQPTTSIPNVSKRTQPMPSMPNVSTHHQQPTTSIHNISTPTQPTTSTHTQPVSSSDEEEVKAFLGHLKCTLLRIPADLRMEVQADILAMVYARHKEHRQSCK